MKKTKVMVVLNSAWNIVNFRASLVRALFEQGYEVVSAAPPDAYAKEVQALGSRFVELPINNKSKRPWHDLALLWRLYKLLKREKPQVLLCYTIKPNIYASFIGSCLDIPVINNIAGLGASFMHDGWLQSFVKTLYKLALKKSAMIFFQNQDDANLFLKVGLVQEERIRVLPGSGVDLVRFVQAPLPNGAMPRFLLIARLLWSKGVGEYIQAAREIKKRYPNVEFYLAGFYDGVHSDAVSSSDVDLWVKEGVVTFLGESKDVRQEIKQVDCVVLPSYYREGTPRVLLESAAMGRPVITTNMAGCKDVVEDGVTGFLCHPRSAPDLMNKLKLFIDMKPSERTEMGLSGRAKVAKQFDEKIVINQYINVLDSMFGKHE
jgi:glycosyltransferase involved in cell wall biosynthesis